MSCQSELGGLFVGSLLKESNAPVLCSLRLPLCLKVHHCRPPLLPPPLRCCSLASLIPEGADLVGLKETLSTVMPEFSVCLALNPCLPQDFDLLMSGAAPPAACCAYQLSAPAHINMSSN